jgi:peroxiredoxin
MDQRLAGDTIERMANGLMRYARWLAAAAAVVAVGVAYNGRLSAATEKGKPAPAFVGETIDGKKISLADYKGKSAVLLNFFASWCGPCRSEYPHLKELDEQYGKRGFQVISISVDQDREKAGMLARQAGAKFPVVHDAKGELATRFGVSAIPHNVIIDPQGNVVQTVLGADIKALKAAAERLSKAK